MRIALVLSLLVLASLVVAQPAEVDPSKPQSQIVARDYTEQVVLDGKGPFGLTLMRSRVLQVKALSVTDHGASPVAS